MKIYLDFVLFINFCFDFILLLTVKLILKRNVKLWRIIVASLIGSLSIFLLFIKLNSFTLFLFKFVISIIMILIAFGYKSFIKNISYLYFTSIILGGFLYFVNLQTSYKNNGLIFFHNGFSINIIIILIVSPIILYYYFKQSKYFNDTLSNIHSVEIIKNDKVYNYRGYLDTGNKLKDPYKGRSVTLVYDPNLINEDDKFIIIPFKGLSYTGIIKGIVVDKMIIDSKYIFDKSLIGVVTKPFNLEDAEVILHSSLKGKI